MNNFGLYLIMTNPALSHERVAEICVEQGVAMLQIREKQMCDGELLSLCRRIVSITRGSNTKFIVNDRPDIAALCDADGVHLGQDDLSLEDARRIVGADKLIGLSTHSIEQATAALRQKPDYIGFGPVYKTPTKVIPDPVVGTKLLSEIVSLSNVPVVAIGGIDESNIDAVLAAGAQNVCAVRYFMESEQLSQRVKHFQRLIFESSNVK